MYDVDLQFRSTGPSAARGPDMLFVSMPYAAVERPSLALGTLAAALNGEGISTRTIHGNMVFAERIGPAMYEMLNNSDITLQIGEWSFSEAAFGVPGDIDAYIEMLVASGVAPDGLRSWLIGARAAANAFIADFADRIAAERPRMLGCSSVFQQHCASLALLRHVRLRDPSVVTMLGGANCEGAMGLATHASYPWVDYVVSGEADRLIAPLCRQILTHGRDVPHAELPHGVVGPMSRGASDAGTPPRALTERMDELPIPDFDDYFAQLQASPLYDRVLPTIPVETSRGCWWGAKHHCTFCGLNGAGMAFRAKSEARVQTELAHLSQRYGLRKFMTVDNILDMKYFRQVLPSLADEGDALLFYETKANLTRPQVEMLSRAGVRWIQPGIESLHDGVLKLLKKGCSAATNVQLLKWAFNSGIWVMWNHLHGAPGEDPAWYDEVAQWLPLISHLQPPGGGGITRIRYDRFSPYFNEAKAFGLSLTPYPAYAHAYPVAEAAIGEQAYFFLHDGDVPPTPTRFRALMVEWADLFYDPLTRAGDLPERSDTAPVLMMTETDGLIRIRDTRPCAVAERHDLTDLESRICRACDAARSGAAIGEAVRASGSDADDAAVAAGIAALVDKRIVVDLGGHLLCLATGDDPVPYRKFHEFAGGILLVSGTVRRPAPSDPWTTPIADLFVSA